MKSFRRGKKPQPPVDPKASLARGECPFHGVKLEPVGRGVGGIYVFDCVVPGCNFSAKAPAIDGPFEP